MDVVPAEVKSDVEWSHLPASTSTDGSSSTEGAGRHNRCANSGSLLSSSPSLTQLDSWDILRRRGCDEEEEEDMVDVADINKTHKVRMRKRIRRREAVATNPEKMRDQIDEELIEEDENMIAQEDIEIARRSAWVPDGFNLPDLFDIEMGYNTAWDIGRKGCIAAKLNGLWDTQLGPSTNRFFLMDGTDADCFLNYYTKSDMQAANGAESQKRGSICAFDLRDGYWDYKRCKIYIKRSDTAGESTVLTKLSTEFLDAMLICIWEMEIRTYIERLKAQRLDTRRRRQSKKTTGNTTKLPSRLTVHVPCD
eukprot:GHVS01042858.1.p1 GENE.GHVS01042858.1~~GHVS01042858.1.p1  ORF type:complete len:308 (+),score=58.44 GHVS01042858.1:191-1114(+)